MHYNKLKLINSGPEFFEVQEGLINACQNELHFQTYRLDPDETGEVVIQALKNAVKRGVVVYLLLDSYGSNNLDKTFEKEMIQAGIRFKFFSPLLSLRGLFLGRRLHHKLLVADRKKLLLSGINVANKYRGTTEEPPWLDFAVLLSGPIAEESVKICGRLFGRKVSLQRWLDRPVKNRPDQNNKIQLIHNDWLRRNNQVYHAYLREVERAEKYIVLMASYFLPGKRFRKAILMAADRGVEVKLILPGRSDVPYMKHGTSYLYDLLLKYGVKIYEWDHSILHGKAMSVDGKWCTIGSFNLINLSVYGSIETNVEIIENRFVEVFEKKLNDIIEECEYVDPEEYERSKKWNKQLRNRIYYYLIRRVFGIMTFFSYRSWKNNKLKD